MKKNFLCLLTILTVGVWCGCQSLRDSDRVKPQPLSPFLKHQELLVAQQASFPFHFFYIKPDAGTYENVYIAPVNTDYLIKNTNWAQVDQALAEQIQGDIGKMAEFTKTTFEHAFVDMKGPQSLTVVDNPNQPKTLVVSLAIISIVPSKAELTVLGTAANLLLPGIGILANAAAAGSITMECMISDAKTGEIIAMFANTEKDQRAVLNISGMTWYNSAKNNIEVQAENTAKIFSGKDYSYTKRKLLKFITI